MPNLQLISDDSDRKIPKGISQKALIAIWTQINALLLIIAFGFTNIQSYQHAFFTIFCFTGLVAALSFMASKRTTKFESGVDLAAASAAALLAIWLMPHII
jgi:putative Mn2+ efflux pump MntP